MTTTNTNSFWKRPEGNTAKVILGLLGAGALFGLYKVLPFLITIAENTLYLGVLVGIIVGAYLLLTSQWASNMLFLVLQAVSRAITSLFVETDPIGILQSFIKYLEDKAEEIQKSVTTMRSVRAGQADKLRAAEKELQDFLKKAEVAEQQGDAAALDKYTELAGRRDASIKEYQERIAFADEALKATTQIASLIVNKIDLSKDELKDLKEDNENALAMIALSNAANKALGDTGLADIKAMAVDVIQKRVATAKGQIESLIENSKGMQLDADMTRMVSIQDGRKRLAQMKVSLAQAQTTTGTKALTAGPAQPVEVSSKKWSNIPVK
jgi:hypothetical protein